MKMSMAILEADTITCTKCPALRDYCAGVGRTRRRAYADWDYWSRPVPGFGDPGAGVLLVGLAPGAHGANRTGRMFTGDRSGDFLFAALHRAGYASQAESSSKDDGLRLDGIWIGAACRCAPPSNKPTSKQLAACRPWLAGELELLQPRVILALGGIAWAACLRSLVDLGEPVPRPRPRFGHGVECRIGERVLLGSYHVSQLNTFTGRLTPDMFDEILQRVRVLSEAGEDLPRSSSLPGKASECGR